MPTSLKPRTFAPDTDEPAPIANKPLDKGARGLVESVSMREATLPLSALADGDFFRLELMVWDEKTKRSVHTGWTYGQRVYGNNCRVRVRMAGHQRQVVFNDATGQTREFESNGITEMSYPTMLEVVRIDANAAEQSPIGTTERRSDMDAAQEKALRKRFEFATAALAKAAGDAGKTEVAQKRLNGIIAESEAAGVNLATTKPEGNSITTITGKGATTKANAPSKAADVAAANALKAKAAPKEPKAPKLPTTQDCLCGCGLETGGKFRPGHDARVKGWLSKVEQGKYEGGFEALPETLKPHVQFGGSAKTAGTPNQTYRILRSPVKFPGRDDIKVV